MRVVRAVDQHIRAIRSEVSSSRPGQRASANERRMPMPCRRGDAGAGERLENAPGPLRRCRLVAGRVGPHGVVQPVSRDARFRASGSTRSASGRTSRKGTPTRAARRRMTPVSVARGTGHGREVAALDDLGLLGRDRDVVGPRISMWSSATLVIADTPPCQTLVASSRPPSPTSTTRDLDARAGEPQKAARSATSNSVGGPCARDSLGVPQDLAQPRAKSVGGDRLAVDDDPFAVVDQVRLRRLADAVARLAQSGADQRLDAALAVRAADQRAAQRMSADCRARAGAPVCGPRPSGYRNGHAPERATACW